MIFDLIAVYVLHRLEVLGGTDGTARIPAKKMIVGALGNFASYAFVIGLNITIIPLVLNSTDWAVFRGGLAVTITSVLLLMALNRLLASDLSMDGSFKKQVVRLFAAVNVMVTGIIVTIMVGGLIWFTLEFVSRDNIKIRNLKEPLKVYGTLLLTIGGFGLLNVIALTPEESE